MHWHGVIQLTILCFTSIFDIYLDQMTIFILHRTYLFTIYIWAYFLNITDLFYLPHSPYVNQQIYSHKNMGLPIPLLSLLQTNRAPLPPFYSYFILNFNHNGIYASPISLFILVLINISSRNTLSIPPHLTCKERTWHPGSTHHWLLFSTNHIPRFTNQSEASIFLARYIMMHYG